MLRQRISLVRPIFLGKYSRSTPVRVSTCPHSLQVSFWLPLTRRVRRQPVQALCSQAGIMRGWLPSTNAFPQAQQVSSSVLIASNYKKIDLRLQKDDSRCSSFIISQKTMAEFQIYATSPQANSPAQPRPASPTHSFSPTRYDVDFYRRKAERLEEDVLTMGDELNRARLRLRRAEDFEIKYDMLFRQKAVVEEESARRDKELFDLRAKNQELQLRLKERGERSVDDSKEKEQLLAEVALWKERANDAEERARLIAAEEENRNGERAEKEIARMKRNFNEAEEDYKFQIARMTKQLHERTATDNTSFDKQERGRREKEAEIQRLERVVIQNREDFLTMVQEKNAEIEQLRNKFEQLFNAELSHLRQNMGHQDQRFTAELDCLRKLIEVKNAEIANLQQELKQALDHYSTEREELNLEIRLLKEKIYERERLNEQELFNMKERLTGLHAIDIEALKAHYEALIEGLRDERSQLEGLLADRDKKVEFQLREFERGRQELRGIIADRDRTIQDLRAAQTVHSTSSSNEVNSIQSSLAQLASEKEAMLSEHQANTAFLNQQLTKLAASNELKNNQIRELHEYIALLKKEHFDSLRELELRWKNERREREAEREKERDLREKVEEEYREKEKQWRNKERELQREFERERREKNKWNINSDKLEKEIERLFKENRELEELLKAEMGRNQKTVMVSGDSKRELNSELDRQRAELQARKRLQIEQLRKELQLQITRLSHQNEKLQNELTAKRIDYQNLEEEFRKVNTQYRNIEKINKEKLADYHKKMATINSEILLTQNLYQSFIDAKSRVTKKE